MAEQNDDLKKLIGDSLARRSEEKKRPPASAGSRRTAGAATTPTSGGPDRTGPASNDRQGPGNKGSTDRKRGRRWLSLPEPLQLRALSG